MADYASLLGGNADDTLLPGSVRPNEDAYYHLDSENVFLDRSGGSGDSLVDAIDNFDAVRVELGSGTDTVFGGTGGDRVWTGAGTDVVWSGNGNDTVSGASGADSIMGGGGGDSLLGGSGGDSVLGGSGNDYLSGGAGADLLRGEDGNDTVLGGSGDDSLYGQNGNDYMVGGSGADLLMGGAGADSLFGGSGRDVFAFDDGFGRDVISDFRPGDQINLASNLNGTGIGSAEDLVRLNMVSGGTTDAGTKFTLITIGNDTIRLENTDSADFIDQINSWVKVG